MKANNIKKLLSGLSIEHPVERSWNGRNRVFDDGD